jgi:mannose-6-phosphate isomerase-like protein (cupin superfamily)
MSSRHQTTRCNKCATATLVEIPPGVDVGWHQHPNIRYVYVFVGTLTIELEDGTRREFPHGTIFVEALGTRHHGMNTGSAPTKVLFIDHAEEGQSWKTGVCGGIGKMRRGREAEPGAIPGQNLQIITALAPENEHAARKGVAFSTCATSADSSSKPRRISTGRQAR